MPIAHGHIVAIDYTLTDDAGAILDTSDGRPPLQYLHGHGNIVPGLEAALDGAEVGAAMKVDVAPEEGYGTHDPGRIARIGREQLPPDLEPKVGMQLGAQGPDGETFPLWIVEVHDDAVVMDGNHPLAGQTLHFQVTVRGIREATAAELHHGHPHGPGGHPH